MSAFVGASFVRGVSLPAPCASSSGSRSVTCMAQRLQGTVVSTAMQKSITVSVASLVPHPIYTKRVKSTKMYIVHDEEGTAKVGDYVELLPTRPISKNKRFKLGEVLREAI